LQFPKPLHVPAVSLIELTCLVEKVRLPAAASEQRHVTRAVGFGTRGA